jgi:hypothetical protein
MNSRIVSRAQFGCAELRSGRLGMLESFSKAFAVSPSDGAAILATIAVRVGRLRYNSSDYVLHGVLRQPALVHSAKAIDFQMPI